ncbi:MAG: ATP-binding protein [Verrucomicrobia bacterium]|nr:ATP-binding protein [Verrucomicrobiota bacterium]
MPVKPWYKIVTPREDLREGKPLDAAEFAVHLDQVREGRAPEDYQKPERFFERTYLTKNLMALAAETIRRLSGEKTETSAVFNLATQFGGGKTHALTLLYHLAKHGPAANKWTGVRQLLDTAGVAGVPKAKAAVFVGTEFDSITGRGGRDGTPLRKTPWGEIAWQLGGEKALAVLAEHEKAMTAPSGEVIRGFLPEGQPCLILMDELMNYASRSRRLPAGRQGASMGAQLYSFLQNLSEVARGMDNVVLAVSIPASELEMTAEDQSDYERFKKVLDRLGKAIVMSAEAETSEIIRRRLFEWDERAVTSEGKVMLSKEALETCNEYADWVVAHRQQLPSLFNVDGAREAFAAAYPFHPALISVFERKWQELPRFQQTRGILRLLALWVSKTYQEGFKGAHKDAVIGLGTAPLDDAMFRSAVFEQLGETKLEGAVTTDICGKKDSHAVRLDAEAQQTIKNARLHRKAATAIFFESNGGQAKAEATQPEIRFAVADPGLDIGNVETVLEALTEASYYLAVERNRYRFSLKENLNKRFADRRATIPSAQAEEYVRGEIQKVFDAGGGVERRYFPEKTIQVPDRPAVTLVVLPPEQSLQDEKTTTQFVETMTRGYGTSARTFKSALVFCVPESGESIRDDARKVLAWEAIEDDNLNLDESQVHQLAESVKKARRDLKETVWRTYKVLMLLGKDNALKKVDLGLIHSSAAADIVTLILSRLRSDGDLETGIAPSFVIRNWPPAFKEWSTKAVRDAFFASPQFPRLINPEVLKETISRGVGNGQLGYVGKTPSGEYKPFCFNQALMTGDVELTDEMFIVTKETAEAYLKGKTKPTGPPARIVIAPQDTRVRPDEEIAFSAAGLDEQGNPVPLVGVVWKVNGGTIDDTGKFCAGNVEGRFAVEARLNGIRATASFTITETAPPPPPPPPPPGRGFAWTGEIPPQKWMNFYTKVLSKFASARGLKLTLKVEVTPEGGLSKQKLDETKSALRELGLNDDVSAR